MALRISILHAKTCFRSMNLHVLGQRNCTRHLSTSHVLSADSKPPVAGEPPMGKIFEKKPVKVVLEAGQLYSWCTCGLSQKQPFCDGGHKSLNAKDPQQKTPFRSHKFQVDETKEFYLCNCKQTRNRPFCDGVHKEKWIQDAVI